MLLMANLTGSLCRASMSLRWPKKRRFRNRRKMNRRIAGLTGRACARDVKRHRRCPVASYAITASKSGIIPIRSTICAE